MKKKNERKTQLIMMDIPEDAVDLIVVAECYRNGKVVREGRKINASQLVDGLNMTKAFFDYVTDIEHDLKEAEDLMQEIVEEYEETYGELDDDDEEDEGTEEIIYEETVEETDEDVEDEKKEVGEALNKFVDLLGDLLKGLK